MIRHCVFTNIASDADLAEQADVVTGLDALATGLDGCTNFTHAPNRDFEGKSQDFPYGFTFDAVDAATLQTYAEHPTLKALGARLVAL